MNSKAGTIIVALDGSESSNLALAWAVDQAVAERRPLTLVHSVNAITPAFTDAAIVYPQDALQSLRAAGQEVLAAARAEVERRAPGLEVHEVLRQDDPRQALIELSREAAMVVLGSRGRGTVRSLLLGSVGVAVVRHAKCPVVVHRPSRHGLVRNGVIVGADGTEDSRVVLEFAYHQSAVRGLPLTVLQCFWDVGAESVGGYVVPAAAADPDTERRLLAESMAGMTEKYPEVNVRAEVLREQPQEALVRIGERMDLIVVGAHQDGRLNRLLFGSVSTTVVEHATTPVAVVPLSTGE
jgi:nucleotide-binding universal stress UspA family protein